MGRVGLLVASLAALCSSQLVHLCDALLEFFVLALFVRVSFVLFWRCSSQRVVLYNMIERWSVIVSEVEDGGSKRTSHFQGK